MVSTNQRRSSVTRLPRSPVADARRQRRGELAAGRQEAQDRAASQRRAGLGALSGSLTDVGIDDNFIKRVRDRMTPGRSALFVLSANAVGDLVAEAFSEEPATASA